MELNATSTVFQPFNGGLYELVIVQWWHTCVLDCSGSDDEDRQCHGVYSPRTDRPGHRGGSGHPCGAQRQGEESV